MLKFIAKFPSLLLRKSRNIIECRALHWNHLAVVFLIHRCSLFKAWWVRPKELSWRVGTRWPMLASQWITTRINLLDFSPKAIQPRNEVFLPLLKYPDLYWIAKLQTPDFFKSRQLCKENLRETIYCFLTYSSGWISLKRWTGHIFDAALNQVTRIRLMLLMKYN